ncbi:hypothetical protein [Ammoniphilus sp. YIM 78166]|uniref:hypothetical protein n=1 Tax=Ammoniphilus sp. YIM 78166 TaxID=1644106 RepID=UPI0014319721|nr:hypothetical protein [Ammoniphilus sp. YIM 78166]
MPTLGRMTQVDWLDFVFRMKEETNTLLSINVILWEEASEALRKRVEEEGRVLYERSQDSAKPSEFGKGS